MRFAESAHSGLIQGTIFDLASYRTEKPDGAVTLNTLQTRVKRCLFEKLAEALQTPIEQASRIFGRGSDGEILGTRDVFTACCRFSPCLFVGLPTLPR